MTVQTEGFTLVELVIVITIVGILAGISIVTYGSWRVSIAQKEVQSDLQLATSAMENSKNFMTGYPSTLPATFTPSQNVSITYHSGSGTSYCLNGVSLVNGNVRYFVNTSTGSKIPRVGTC